MTQVKSFEEYLKTKGLAKAELLPHEMDEFLSLHDLSLDEMLVIFREMKTLNRDVYVYGLSLLGRLGVLESIYKKACRLSEGNIPDFDYPREGMPMSLLPDFAQDMTEFLKEHLGDKALEALADNHHEIPDEAFFAEKEFYDQAESLEVYLKGRHERKVATLQEHCDQDKVWFEQIITQEVVDYVKDHPEMLSGVIEDGYLYITKIPYDTVGFLHGQKDVEKRASYCHCGLARAAIKSGKVMDGDWCYCSAGFAKRPFEVIMGRELQVEVLESVLKGDMRCRFRVPV